MDGSLSLFLKAPTKEAIEKCFQLLFQHRHDPPLVSVTAVRGLSLGLSVEEVPLLVTSAGNLLRRVLYESSELSTVEAVKALLPRGLDSRLESLLATVRGEDTQAGTPFSFLFLSPGPFILPRLLNSLFSLFLYFLPTPGTVCGPPAVP